MYALTLISFVLQLQLNCTLQHVTLGKIRLDNHDKEKKKEKHNIKSVTGIIYDQ